MRYGGALRHPPILTNSVEIINNCLLFIFLKNLLTFVSFCGIIQTSNKGAVIMVNNPREPPKKSKYFCCILYPDSVSYDTDKVIKALAEERLTFALSPIHDRDVQDDGSLKKGHYHLLLAYSSATTLNNIRCWLNACGMPDSELHSVRVCASGVGYYRYLTHKDNPEKAQYFEKDIRIFNDYDGIFKRFANMEIDKIDNLVRIFQIVDNLNTISFHNLIQHLMLNERELFKMLTCSSALAICVKEYQRSLEYDLKNS